MVMSYWVEEGLVTAGLGGVAAEQGGGFLSPIGMSPG